MISQVFTPVAKSPADIAAMTAADIEAVGEDAVSLGPDYDGSGGNRLWHVGTTCPDQRTSGRRAKRDPDRHDDGQQHGTGAEGASEIAPGSSGFQPTDRNIALSARICYICMSSDRPSLELTLFFRVFGKGE